MHYNFCWNSLTLLYVHKVPPSCDELWVPEEPEKDQRDEEDEDRSLVEGDPAQLGNLVVEDPADVEVATVGPVAGRRAPAAAGDLAADPTEYLENHCVKFKMWQI